MRVLIAGANGKIGKHLVRMLAEKGHDVRAMIRSEDQAQGMRDLGGIPVVADLEGDISGTAEGCDAVVFTAGGGPGSGAAKKETVDRHGAVKLIEAAKEHDARRYVMVSSMARTIPRPARRRCSRTSSPRRERTRHSGRAVSTTPSSTPGA